MDETGCDSNDLVEESEPHDDDIQWEYYPNACHEPEVFHFKAYQLRSPVVTPLVDPEPWLPFKMREDFEFSKIALAIVMTKTQVNAMIDLLHRCIDKGEGSFTLSNHDEMCWTLGVASDQLPKVCLGSL